MATVKDFKNRIGDKLFNALISSDAIIELNDWCYNPFFVVRLVNISHDGNEYYDASYVFDGCDVPTEMFNIIENLYCKTYRISDNYKSLNCFI
jgi:hypothetical protein